MGLDSKVIRAKIIFPLNHSMLQIICETMYKTNLNKNRPFCSALGSMTFQHFWRFSATLTFSSVPVKIRTDICKVYSYLTKSEGTGVVFIRDGGESLTLGPGLGDLPDIECFPVFLNLYSRCMLKWSGLPEENSIYINENIWISTIVHKVNITWSDC